MDRLTIRKVGEDGVPYYTTSPWVNAQEVRQRLAAYEDTGLEPQEVLHIKLKANEFDRIMALGNCNVCRKSRSCEYRPDWGDTVRMNCPLFEAEAALGGDVDEI